jgi:multidrug efflux pump subunit AcrA (membrane-fusion protein)
VQQLAEQQRIQAEQLRAQQLAEQQRIQAERERVQQLAEQQRIQAEQLRAQELAEQQRARQQAEQLARENAEQAERLARQAPAPARDSGLDGAGPAPASAPANSGIDGVGRGAGALPRTALDSPLVTRARELLRGIELDKPVPQAMRPAEDARRNPRRALADSAQHDVPLRMYIDSIRQKIERNAIVSPSHLASDAVRIFPIVSITVRSDGSIEDVTILRSSGRADIDEVVRRIVHLNARYAAFPPNVAAHYDVVELRRVWSFAGVLRLLEEMR